MRRLIVLGFVVGALGAAPARSAADNLELLSVTGALRGTTAVLTVRYKIAVDGPLHQASTVELVIPGGAVATRARVHAGNVTHTLQLTTSDRALEAFDALAERDPARSRRWAVLLAGEDGLLTLSVAAAMTSAFELEVDLAMPTCFLRDVRYIAIPATWQRVLPATLSSRHAPSAAVGLACRPDEIDGKETWLGFPSPGLARRPAGEPRIGASAARVALGATHVARVELEISRLLGEAPADLSTVLVVDGSRSMTSAQLDAQRALVAAYLRAAPASRVQVIAFARTAKALLPAWTVAGLAAPRLDRELRALVPRNGSNFDHGLAEASRWLAQLPGTRRVIVMTDELAAHRLRAHPEQLARVLPPQTLVHAIAVDEDGEPTRDDTMLLAPLAAATGGMSMRAGLDDGVALDLTLLVRPRSLDRITVLAPGWTRIDEHLSRGCDERLVEGMACQLWAEGDAIAGPIAIGGYVWGTRVNRVLHPDATRAVEVARELSFLNILDDDVAEQVLVVARAVNRMWSLYGEWGGTGGYSDRGASLRGMSCCGSRSSSTSTSSGFFTRGPAPPPLDLEPQLAAAVATCDLGGAKAIATIETTYSEIVDVAVTIDGVSTPSLLACIEDAIWGTPITVPQHFMQHTTKVVFGD